MKKIGSDGENKIYTGKTNTRIYCTKKNKTQKYKLHRLLCTMLSQKLTQSEKLNIIEKEYDIPLEDNIRKDVSVMCNLSQGIVDETRAETRAETKAEIIMNMYENNFTVQQISLATKQSVEEVEGIIKEHKSVLV